MNDKKAKKSSKGNRECELKRRRLKGIKKSCLKGIKSENEIKFLQNINVF